MRTKTDILKQSYFVIIGLSLILFTEFEILIWIGWAFIIEYFRRLIFYSYRVYKEKKTQQTK